MKIPRLKRDQPLWRYVSQCSVYFLFVLYYKYQLNNFSILFEKGAFFSLQFQSNQDAPDNEEDRIAQEILIENALRSRCQAIVQCEEKCSVESEEKPKKFCQKSCKAVFDHLLNCPPQGNQKKEKKKKDKCGPATGKTCPPSW